VLDYRYTEFDDFNFSRFGFIVRRDIYERLMWPNEKRQIHRQRWVIVSDGQLTKNNN